jgi:hypothetical protein
MTESDLAAIEAQIMALAKRVGTEVTLRITTNETGRACLQASHQGNPASHELGTYAVNTGQVTMDLVREVRTLNGILHDMQQDQAAYILGRESMRADVIRLCEKSQTDITAAGYDELLLTRYQEAAKLWAAVARIPAIPERP